MPSPRIHYVTLSGGPPNGGVPPGIVFSGQIPPPPSSYVAPRPDMVWAPPPPPFCVPPPVCAPPPACAPPPYEATPAPTCPPPACYGPPYGPPPNMFCPIPVFTPPPTPCSPLPSNDHFTPPGSTLNGVTPDLSGFGYIFPPSASHTTIAWVQPPHRPCDSPGQSFELSKYKVATTIKIKELVAQLGGVGDGDGITEIYEQGNGRWAEGLTYKKNGDLKDKTLAQVGWTERRGDANPVILCCKRE